MVNRNQNYFFYALLLIVGTLAVFIFLPYLTALILALMLSVLFRPLHHKIARIFAKGNEQSSWATIITLCLVVLLVLTPISFLAFQISSEAQDLYVYLTHEGHRVEIISKLNDIAATLSFKFFGQNQVVSFDSFDVTTYIRTALAWSFTNIDSLFTKIAELLFNLFILLFALYYLLRDGAQVRKVIKFISPLNDSYDELILSKLERAINSVVRGSLVVGATQGFLTGIGFYIFGVPNPTLWGSLAAVASLIPGVGTALVLLPGVGYLALTGNYPMAIGLLIWGFLAVGLIDNFLGPIMVKHGVEIHEFLILLSVMGGLAFFGAIGIVLGPLVLSFLFALLDIYKQVVMPGDSQPTQ